MECYTSKVKLLGLFGLACLMTGMSYVLTMLPGLPVQIVGWIGVCFFGLGFIAIPMLTLRTGPQVVINDEGIEDRRLKIGMIRWEEIQCMWLGSIESVKFLCIELVDPQKYERQLPTRSRWMVPVVKKMGFPALTIGFSGLHPGIKEVWSFLKACESTHPERYHLEPGPRLDPECRFVVRLSDSEVVCERPDGKVERVGWNDLMKVEVVTTSAGPYSPDVFWVLHGTDGGCAVPQGATGDSQLLERLQALPGFDNGEVIKAMTCAEDKRFLCWQRTA